MCALVAGFLMTRTLIARDLDEVHGTNMLNKQTALTEKGAVVNGRGDTPNTHDILTGSQPDGKAFPPDKDMTCKNWTSSTGGAAMLGHSDRTGLTDDPPGRSWNSSHPSRDCSQDGLKSNSLGEFLSSIKDDEILMPPW